MRFIKIFLAFILVIPLYGCSFSKNNTDPALSITASPTPNSSLVTTTASPTPSSITVTIIPSPIQPSSTQPPIENMEYEKIAKNILDTMTQDEKIGQMFFVRCKASTAEADINKYHPGGLILFATDFEKKTKDIVINNIISYQKASDIPLLIGVDEEGGLVNRVSQFSAFRSAPFQSPQKLFRSGGFELIKTDAIEKALLLKNLGINVNLSPVCDVSTDPTAFIYQRSFGKNAEKTGEYVETVVSAMASQKIGCTLKHFPGYGNNVDTHTEIAIDTRKSSTFYQNDFHPFIAGIKAGAGSIMVCHNIVTCFDKNKPASLSLTIHEILRDTLNFKGVIMSDDLSMAAIKQYTNDEEAAVTAVLAGNDLLIVSDYELQISAVADAVANKRISKNLIDEAVLRILIWKLSLGILQ